MNRNQVLRVLKPWLILEKPRKLQLLIDHCQKLTKNDIRNFTSNTCGAEYKHGNIYGESVCAKKWNKKKEQMRFNMRTCLHDVNRYHVMPSLKKKSFIFCIHLARHNVTQSMIYNNYLESFSWICNNLHLFILLLDYL